MREYIRNFNYCIIHLLFIKFGIILTKGFDYSTSICKLNVIKQQVLSNTDIDIIQNESTQLQYKWFAKYTGEAFVVTS